MSVFLLYIWLLVCMFLDYRKFMVGRAILAGVMAYKKMEDAKIGAASRNVEGIAFNRRFKLKDGSFVTNLGFPNPEIECPIDIVDPELLVLRADHADGTPMGMIANYIILFFPLYSLQCTYNHLDTARYKAYKRKSSRRMIVFIW